MPHFIPRPATVEPREGRFRLQTAARILHEGANARPAAELLAEVLRPATGFPLPVADGDRTEDGDILLRTTAQHLPDEAGFLPESYTCDISPRQMIVQAESTAGLARAVQTLRQAFPPEIFSGHPVSMDWTLPSMHIEDAPRFRWRGLHLDVSRHFFSLDEVRRFIDLLALHRFNVCHLHLTDDQGWRVEIQKYPRLTEVGSVRPCTLRGPERNRPRQYDSSPYEGFYTQKDLRALVAFAARRHILLVPEIDMPGHMQSAIAAYPELGNTDRALTPRCHWGISQHILNVEEDTMRFMEDVLDEIIDIFPGRFIHIGGDEALKHEWSESPRVQARMAELGYANESEMQSGFLRRMGAHISRRGRRLIGWDEIIEGGLAYGATVMSWRGEDGGITAARAGHDVVMAPHQWVYFDYYQSEPVSEEPLAIGGMTPTDRVYAYNPVPQALPEAFHKHVLGAQGQLWTEYIPSMEHLEYMTYPRACALAEVLWTDQKCYADFLDRLHHHRARLNLLNVHAHPRP